MTYNYFPICKPNQLIIGQGQTVISTGWTIASVVANKLAATCFAAIGQLYNAESGIDYLVRNLLANPHVRHLIVLDGTQYDKNSGASKCLVAFFKDGATLGRSKAGNTKWIVNSPVCGYINADVPVEAIKIIRESITVHRCDTVAAAVSIAIALTNQPSQPWGEPLHYLPHPVQGVELSGELIGNRIEECTIAEAWVSLLHRTISFGQKQTTGYDGYIWELINTTTIIKNEPSPFYFPSPNYLPVTPTSIKEYIPQLLENTPKETGVKYTYGQRIRSHFGYDQIQLVIDKLRAEHDCKSAVITLWDVDDNIKGGSPCLNHIWFRLIDSRLLVSALFRSHDIFGAWVSNAFGLRALQCEVATALKVIPAELIITSQSCHIYEHSVDHAAAVVKEHYHPKLKYDDPTGNFVIDGNEVIQTTPTGEEIRWYSGKSPLKLVRQIIEDNPQIQPAHAAYLGVELQRLWR